MEKLEQDGNRELWPDAYCTVEERDAAINACERIMCAIAGHTDWHPSPKVDVSNWSEDAHIEVTITVRDCRALKRVLEAAGRLEKYMA